MSHFLRLAILIPLTFSFLFAQSSERKKLEGDRKKLEKEISLTSKMLKETRSRKEKSRNELKLLKRQINLRETLVGKLSRELQAIDVEIANNEGMIGDLEEDIEQLRDEYARLSVATYTSMNKKPMSAYIFGSKDLSQGYQRVRYFRELSNYQKSHIELIRKTKAFLLETQDVLSSQREDKAKLIDRKSSESTRLSSERKNKDKLYDSLKASEKDFAQDLNKKKKALKDLLTKITRLIEDEERKLSVMEKDLLLPLSREFAGNKNKLPWPLPSGKGIITAHFGVQEDEQGIEVNNQGIDIATVENQPIRSVFNGKVMEVQSIPFYGKVIIIQHGQYYTVYTHLKDAYVTKGQEIKKLDPIGVAKTDNSSGETKVHFQVFKEKTPLNPEQWIVKKK